MPIKSSLGKTFGGSSLPLVSEGLIGVSRVLTEKQAEMFLNWSNFVNSCVIKFLLFSITFEGRHFTNKMLKENIYWSFMTVG